MRAREAAQIARDKRWSYRTASASISPAIVRKDVKLARSGISGGSENMQMQRQRQKQMQMQPHG